MEMSLNLSWKYMTCKKMLRSICKTVEGMSQIQKDQQCFSGEEIKHLDAKLEE